MENLQSVINHHILQTIRGDIWPKELRISPALHDELLKQVGPIENYMETAKIIRDESLDNEIRILGGYQDIEIKGGFNVKP